MLAHQIRAASSLDEPTTSLVDSYMHTAVIFVLSYDSISTSGDQLIYDQRHVQIDSGDLVQIEFPSYVTDGSV